MREGIDARDEERLAEIVAGARAEDRERLTESEGLDLAELLGLAVPVRVEVPPVPERAAAALAALGGPRVVLKAVSPDLAHKSDVGGVATVEAEGDAVRDAAATMRRRFADAGLPLDGFLVCEAIDHDPGPGGELLLGLRDTADFGPVVSLGLGGLHAETLAGALAPERRVAVLSPELTRAGEVEELAVGTTAGELAARPHRGMPPRLDAARLTALLQRSLGFAARAVPSPIRELELNPVVIDPGGRLVALDALARLGRPPAPPAAPRPQAALRRLLEPRTMAVIGVSRRRNPGRILLENTLAAGFDPARLWVIKPGVGEVAGCPAVPDLAALPEPVDLLVVAVEAAAVPDLLDEAVAEGRARSIVLIPGGLGERAGSEGRGERIQATLAASRARPDGGPVVVGGNCLGVRSVPGRYDTLFIPRHKLRLREGESDPLAVVSQSGAFAIARASQRPHLAPRFLVTLGNQLDATVGDLLATLAERDDVSVFACYVEGFRPGDGRRFLAAARRIVDGGRPVILYRAGRTVAGRRASASHTASVAGDYAVTRELARAAGVVVAESLDEFDDLVELFTLLAGRRPRGDRLAAISNAGFECVAAGDHLGRLRLAELATETRRRLEERLAAAGVADLVEVHNPLDVTPIADDAAFADCTSALLDDPGVDLGVVGCVPLTGALRTLAAGDGHDEDVLAEGSVVQRLARAFRAGDKPWAAVIDSGPDYDAAARELARQRVPTFRTLDRALRALDAWRGWWMER